MVSLRQAAEMLEALDGDQDTATDMRALAREVEDALAEYAVVEHEKYGKIYAFEVDGFGSRLLMDDANVPSLLSLPYLDAVSVDDEIYQNTRDFIWSTDNPFFFSGNGRPGHRRAARGDGYDLAHGHHDVRPHERFRRGDTQCHSDAEEHPRGHGLYARDLPQRRPYQLYPRVVCVGQYAVR